MPAILASTIPTLAAAGGPAHASLLPDWLNAQTLIENFISSYGTAAVIGIALVVFIETGLFFPLLPGDSLLFVAGAFAGTGHGELGIPLPILCLIMFMAAFLGDQNAYWIGRGVGPKLFKPDSRIFKKKYIDKTHEYFERYGGRTIVIARFVPIVRTFSAVSAGVSRMSYRTFVTYDAIGAFFWGCGVTILGSLLGNIPFIKDNIEALLVLIVLISVVPMALEILKARKKAKSEGLARAAMEVLDGEDLLKHDDVPAGVTGTSPVAPAPADVPGVTAASGVGRDAAAGAPPDGVATPPRRPLNHQDVFDDTLPPRHARG